MLGIYYQQLEIVVLQEIIDWFPVNAGAFHGHLGNSHFFKPVGHVQKVPSHGPKSPHFLPAGVIVQATTVFLWISSPQQRW